MSATSIPRTWPEFTARTITRLYPGGDMRDVTYPGDTPLDVAARVAREVYPQMPAREAASLVTRILSAVRAGVPLTGDERRIVAAWHAEWARLRRDH